MAQSIGNAARNSFLEIMSHAIANAEPKAEQKELIMIAHENGLIDTAKVYSLIEWYGLHHIR